MRTEPKNVEILRLNQNNCCSSDNIQTSKGPQRGSLLLLLLLSFICFSSFCSTINFLSRKMCTTTLNIRIYFYLNNSTLNVVHLRLNMNKETAPDPNCRGPLLFLVPVTTEVYTAINDVCSGNTLVIHCLPILIYYLEATVHLDQINKTL